MGFRATQNPDTKKWNVFDIPVLPEIKWGEHDLNESWMRSAIARAKQRESEGYRYRLHKHHHKTDKRTEPAGFFTPTSVRDYVYEGKNVRALFVDYQDMPDSVYQEMKRDGLPHRSLECLDVTRDVPEIDSISLLDTPTPKFRFKVTTGDTLEEVPFAASDETSGGQRHELVLEDGPVNIWSCEEDNHFLALFKEVIPTMKGMLRFSENRVVFVGEDGAEITEGISMSANGAELEVTSIEMPKVDDKSEELTAAQEKIASLEAELAARNQADDSSVEKIAEMRGRLDRLEAKDTKKELVASAVADLKGRGFQVGEELEADLAQYAEKGESVLNSYVESYAKFAAPDPASITTVVGKDSAPADSDVVAKFVAECPERADDIRAASFEYQDAKSALGLSCSEESFIRDRVGV